MKNWLFLVALATFIYSCENSDPEEGNSEQKISVPTSNDHPLFTLLKDTGIDFNNKLVDDPMSQDKNILSFQNYFHGAGVSIGDINNDGLLDILFTGNEVENKLFLNKGNMHFEDISKKSNINLNKGWATGATMADVNGDGYLDIYISQQGPFNTPRSNRKNLLFINNRDLTFSEIGSHFNLDDSNLSTQAVFFDYDNDGDLDCFTLNTSKYIWMPIGNVLKELENKKNLEEASSNLFRNDHGKFTKVTEEAGLLRYGFGLGVVASDINNDGWIDIYQSNDYSVPDFMYINNGDGTFTDQTKKATKQITFYGMGCDIADINNDGLLDIGVVDMASSDHIMSKTLMPSMSSEKFWTYVNKLHYQYQFMFNSLQLNNGNGTFSNIANLSHVASSEWSWASLFADFDNDGDKDYFIANGFRKNARDNDSRLKRDQVRKDNNGQIPASLRKKLYKDIPEIELANRFFVNNGDLTFTNRSKENGLETLSYSNGAAYGDLDNDGDLDLVVNNIDMQAFIYQNNSKSNFLKCKLLGKSKKSPIIGTKVYIYTQKGKQLLEYFPTRGYQSACATRELIFGLGKVSKIDKLEVIWPNKQMQIIENIDANQTITLKQSDATLTKDYSKESTKTMLGEIDQQQLNIPFVHRENLFDDFEKEILLPHKQSTLGPKMAIGDVNGDGLEDFYIGGAKDQVDLLAIQQPNGQFKTSTWGLDKKYEDLNAEFMDIDGDQDLDLYVCSGGGGDIKPNSNLLQDRFYINDGKGNFSPTRGLLPQITSSSSVAKAADFDNDGDLDVFVGGRAIPGKYPFPDQSHILQNNNGKLIDITQTVNPKFSSLGIVTDALWTDFNKDGKIDLIVVGEWMNISFFENQNNKLIDVSHKYLDKPLKGWWYSITQADIDNDGDMDLICGNLGENSKFHASDEKPFQIFSNDFDGNGTNDVVLVKKYKGKNVPARGRECSSQQMPFILEKFPTYSSFAHADVETILGEGVNSALKLDVNYFKTTVLINENGKFIPKPLPNIAQLSPTNGIIAKDINQDGNIDLIIAGNNFDTEIETPRYDAGTGRILLGNGDGSFKPISIKASGFYASLNAKDIKLIKKQDGFYIAVSNNNDRIQFFQLK